MAKSSKRQTNAKSKQDAPIEDAPPIASEESKKSRFLDALVRSLGCALAACRTTGIDRAEFEKWLREDEEFVDRVRLVAEDALDYVESRMFEEIKSGNARLIQFYLEKKGAARGYGKEEKNDRKGSIAVLTQDEMEY